MDEDRFHRDKAAIRAELELRARAGLLITYSEAASMVGRPVQGLGRLLDAIKAEERARDRPDLGCLVVSVRTALPSHVGQSGAAQAAAIAVREAVFRAWAGKPSGGAVG